MKDSNKLPAKDVDELMKDYVQGMSMDDIKKKYKIQQAAINSYLVQKQNKQREYEIEPIIHEAREVQRIAEIKDQILEFIKQAMGEALSEGKKMEKVAEISTLLDKVDRISRLSQNKATDINKTTNIDVKLDIAKTMEQLKTADDKKAFLLNQIDRTQNNNKKVRS